MKKKMDEGFGKRYNVKSTCSRKDSERKREKEIKIPVDISFEDEKKIKEIIEAKARFRNIEHFIRIAVRKLLREELSKRTLDDVKIFSEINKRMKIDVFLFDEKQKVISIDYVKVGNLAEFQLFETKDCIAIIVDRGNYNDSLASEIISDSYYGCALHDEIIEIKNKDYLIYFYYKKYWNEFSYEEAKEKLLKATLEFRMKTIDGFLTNTVFFC